MSRAKTFEGFSILQDSSLFVEEHMLPEVVFVPRVGQY